MAKDMTAVMAEWREGEEFIASMDGAQRERYEEAVEQWSELLRGVFSGSELRARYLAEEPSALEVNTERAIQQDVGPVHMVYVERAAYYRRITTMSTVKQRE